ALDIVAGGFQDARHCVADDAATAAANRDRPARIGADKFDLRALSCAQRELEQIVAFGQNRLYLLAQPVLVQAKVDVTGMRYLDRADDLGLRYVVGDLRGDVKRVHARRFGKLQGDSCRVIALFWPAWRLDHNRRDFKSGQVAGGLRRLNGLFDKRAKFVWNQLQGRFLMVAIGVEKLAGLYCRFLVLARQTTKPLTTFPLRRRGQPEP